MTLDDLGPRLCILGPSNSGKSTLAAAIENARGLPAVHLDRLYHQPGTDWQPRSADAFAALHAEAVAGRRWVIEGNYSWLLHVRLVQATGLIVLDVPLVTGLGRYLARCRAGVDCRIGGPEGAPERIRPQMLWYVAVAQRRKLRRQALIADNLKIPILRLASVSAINLFYRNEGLGRIDIQPTMHPGEGRGPVGGPSRVALRVVRTAFPPGPRPPPGNE